MGTTRFKGETAGERLDYQGVSDNDMFQLRHKPGTIEDSDKGISKSDLLSCPFGVSSTAAGTIAKTASLTDSNPDFTLVSGREVVVYFSTANTVSGPTLNFAGSGAIPLYMPNGAPVGAWNAGAWMHLKYFSATVGGSTISRWILMSQEVDNEVILSSSTSVMGKSILAGSTIKIMFTSDIAGSDGTSAMVINYNGTNYNVKVGKDGSLANFVAANVSGAYKYLQAYTTLELAFDGTQFIIIGNPVVISNSDYTIYTDGTKVNKKTGNYNLVITTPLVRGGGVIYYKTGNVITIQFDRLNTSDVTTNSFVEVGTIPGGFRPNSNYRDVAAGVVCGTTSGQRQIFSVTVSKTGVIKLYNDYGNLNNTNFYATGSFSYITDL